MASIEVRGGRVVFELLGQDGRIIVLTPGGRFAMDIPGLRPLAEALVADGFRVLLWDRPNCGASDIQFFGQSESHMRAEILHGLLTELGTGPCILAGGSGGARDSMLTAMLYPEAVAGLALWNIVGGVYGTINLAAVYVLPSLQVVRGLGVKGLLTLPEWQQRIAANPTNRDRLLALDRDEFITLSLRWLNAYVPKPGQTIPGVDDELFRRITVPAVIIRGGKDDLDHPKRTSLEVSCLIRESVVVDPPWSEDYWERAIEEYFEGDPSSYNMFSSWPLAAPVISEFFS